MPDLVAISNAAADAANIPRLLLLAAGVAESNLRADARRPTAPADDERYWPDVSFGAWQQTIRWSAEHLKACSKAGADPARFPGTGAIESIGRIYTDPEYAAEVAAAGLKAKYRPSEPDAVFRALCRYNWPAGDGEPVDDATAANYRRGITEATRLLGDGWPEPANRQIGQFINFDPTIPDEKQRQDWTCAIRSTMWLLKSIGIAVSPEDAQDAMSPRYVTPELGLLNADGSGIVAVLRDRWGVAAENRASVTFDQVAAWAGRTPVAIGGRNWGGPGKGHWSAVRGFDGTRLLLANPASGTVYGDASLTREQWAWRGPWSAVTVRIAEAAAVSQPPADDLAALRQQVVSLTAQLEDKARRLDTEVSKVGYMTGDLADALQAVVNTLRSLRPPAA